MVAIVKVSSIHFILSIHFLLLDTSYDVLGNSEDTSSNKSAVQKSDFRILKTIGRGTYGKVYLVQHNQTEQIFAMKSVLKDLLIQTDQVAGIRGKL